MDGEQRKTHTRKTAFFFFRRLRGGGGSLLRRLEDGVVSQDLAQLVEAKLHLRNAGQLGLQPLLLLRQGEARGRVQLLEAPAAHAVELQQVGVVLPSRKDSALRKHLKGEQDSHGCQSGPTDHREGR